MHSPRWTGETCPRCGGRISRVHRHFTDRLLDLVIPVRRYRCRSSACRWEGLRVVKRHGKRRRRTTEHENAGPVEQTSWFAGMIPAG
ncbi:MAG TPA: hypothetical protein EYP04_03285 [Anaerolineae bacterium]|nr:hypothetical protein [Anaerolineae bacterium]HIQ05027.1 hypothetical protein [Anaerolineae bacterium]